MSLLLSDISLLNGALCMYNFKMPNCLSLKLPRDCFLCILFKAFAHLGQNASFVLDLWL